jgi:hypothetical protein
LSPRPSNPPPRRGGGPATPPAGGPTTQGQQDFPLRSFGPPPPLGGGFPYSDCPSSTVNTLPVTARAASEHR